MKKIGKGWQYTVWDIGEGRVRKILNTKYDTYTSILRDAFPYTEHHIWKFPNYYKNLQNKAIDSIGWVKQADVNLSLFGNPKILDNYSYEQDRAIPLQQHLRTVTIEEGKRIVDIFVSLNNFLLQNGVIDQSFLIGKNWGIDEKGELILIDIGELLTDEGKIQSRVSERPWARPHVIKTIPKELREYFIENMDKHFLSEAGIKSNSL